MVGEEGKMKKTGKGREVKLEAKIIKNRYFRA